MTDKKNRILKFNNSLKNNSMFKKFNNATNQTLTINLKNLEEIFKGNESLMDLGAKLNIGLFSEMCKKSIKNYKKLISKYSNIENNTINDPKNEEALNNFLKKEKKRWEDYLKRRIASEKNNKKVSKDEQNMNENKKIIAEKISRLRIEERTPISRTVCNSDNNKPTSTNSLQQSHVESSTGGKRKIMPNVSNASLDRNNIYSLSHSLNKSIPNIPAQYRNGYQHPSNNHIGSTSMASSSYSHLNAQNQYMAMPSQNRTQYTSINNTYRLSYGTANNTVGPHSMASPSYSNLNAQNQYMAMPSQYGNRPPSGGNTSGGSFHPPVARSDRDSGASSSSNNNSSWPNSNVAMPSYPSGTGSLRKHDNIVTPDVKERVTNRKKIRGNQSGRRIDETLSERPR